MISQFPARKRWGQNFLVDPETAKRIVAAAAIGAGETVLEIGPGDGALTRHLLAAAPGRLVAVEIDPLRAEALEDELGGALRILRGDVLQRPIAEWVADASLALPAVLVANLPYNVATPILSRAIEDAGSVSRIVSTVQREVARRFVAAPGSDDYGFLSVRSALFCRGEILFHISAGAFRPRPKVVSSVLRLVPREPLATRRAARPRSRRRVGGLPDAPKEPAQRSFRARGEGRLGGSPRNLRIPGLDAR